MVPEARGCHVLRARTIRRAHPAVPQQGGDQQRGTGKAASVRLNGRTEKMAAAALGQVGLATSVASDFASGNLGQGLVDSLNLYLPQVAAAYLKSQNNQSNLANVVNADATAASLSGSSDTPAPGTFVGVVSASQVNPADAVSLTTTVGGVTQTTEIAPIGTGSASGSIGIAVQPGVPGTGSAAQTGTGGGDGRS